MWISWNIYETTARAPPSSLLIFGGRMLSCWPPDVFSPTVAATRCFFPRSFWDIFSGLCLVMSKWVMDVHFSNQYDEPRSNKVGVEPQSVFHLSLQYRNTWSPFCRKHLVSPPPQSNSQVRTTEDDTCTIRGSKHLLTRYDWRMFGCLGSVVLALHL